MNRQLPIAEDDLAAFCTRHHVQRLSLFGSVLKGTARPNSDVDLLVEFEGGEAPGLLALSAMEDELSTLMKGRRVDIRTPRDLSRHFRAEVVRTAELQYAR
ncbi:MAG: nucleotidyltransferase domain-containing protein [Polyangia bacterium]